MLLIYRYGGLAKSGNSSNLDALHVHTWSGLLFGCKETSDLSQSTMGNQILVPKLKPMNDQKLTKYGQKTFNIASMIKDSFSSKRHRSFRLDNKASVSATAVLRTLLKEPLASSEKKKKKGATSSDSEFVKSSINEADTYQGC